MKAHFCIYCVLFISFISSSFIMNYLLFLAISLFWWYVIDLFYYYYYYQLILFYSVLPLVPPLLYTTLQIAVLQRQKLLNAVLHNAVELILPKQVIILQKKILRVESKYGIILNLIQIFFYKILILFLVFIPIQTVHLE